MHAVDNEENYKLFDFILLLSIVLMDKFISIKNKFWSYIFFSMFPQKKKNGGFARNVNGSIANQSHQISSKFVSLRVLKSICYSLQIYVLYVFFRSYE